MSLAASPYAEDQCAAGDIDDHSDATTSIDLQLLLVMVGLGPHDDDAVTGSHNAVDGDRHGGDDDP